MRVLVLFRGAPSVGKSTFIKEHALEQYTLSADEIRTRLQSPVLEPNGSLAISQKNDKETWKILFSLLEKRMSKGEFTVIDATNSKTSEMSRYKEMADKYRYRIYVIDMTDIPIDVVKKRNINRSPVYKTVPEAAIDKMYARFATQKVPSGIKVIKPEEFDSILYKPVDLSQYEKIHIVGDIHGNYSVLKDYIIDAYIKECKSDMSNFKQLASENNIDTPDCLRNYMFPNQFYIFVGDYIDRGIENAEVVEFLTNIYELPNIILLEGNHDESLRRLSFHIDDYSKEFKNNTLPQLNKAIGVGKIKNNDIRQLCRKFGQVCYFTYWDKKVLVSHGGLSDMKNNLIYVATEQIIRGVGEYEDYMKCAEAFEIRNAPNTYQVSGHRNVTGVPVQATERCFNLEGKVEFGGYLRVVTLDKNGFETHEIKNNVFREQKEEKEVEMFPKENITNDDIIKSLRNSDFVKEKQMGNISSFNFTRDAFYKKHWDEDTTKARGLFVDTRDNTIAIRGYEKFKAVNEADETKILNLQHRLKFPITAYVKENGFFGLISYNKDTDSLMFATKSVVDFAAKDEDMVNIFKDLYYELVTKNEVANLLEYLKDHNQTIVCECVDQQKDPHIVEYDNNRIYLLDIINNDFDGKKVDYKSLIQFANRTGLICKEKAFTFNNWEDFYGWYLEVTDEDYQYNGRNIEGFVIEDSAGFMIKLKLAYYNFWKFMRSVTTTILKKGQLTKTGCLYNAEANYFYGWLRDHRNEFIHKDDNGKIQINDDVNIIMLRNRFYNTIINKCKKELYK